MGLWEPGPGPRREEAEAQGADALALRGQAPPGLPSLAFLEFYSFSFFEIFFSVCLFFIIFQDKEKESTQQMGILQEVRILFSCPARKGWGGQAPLQGLTSNQ